MRIFILAGISVLFLFSCKPSDKATEAGTDPKVLEEQVMAIHDEVMPKLSDIQDLSSQLRKIRAEIPENTQGKVVTPEGMDDIMESLKLADQSMWDWMDQYSKQRDSIPADQLIPFLNRQMELVKTVETNVNTSITNAKVWLNANGGTNVQ
jgi:hypothetical protein